MMPLRLRAVTGLAAVTGTLLVGPVTAQQFTPIDPRALATFAWRARGPDRGALVSIAADQGFPYRACGADASGHSGCTTVHADPTTTWDPLPFTGEGPVFPDPIDGDVIYSSWLRRYDRRTEQVAWIGPDMSEQLRGQALPSVVAFSSDGRTMFAGRRHVWRSTNGGQSWASISPDLAATDGAETPEARITALSTSPLDNRVVWAGTSRGLVHLTRDAGLSWSVVPPPVSIDATRITAVEGSRFDPQSAYATTSGDSAGAGATVWRTRSLGSAWTNVGLGLPAGTVVHVVREDPSRRGMLLAGTSRGVWFSIDDGGHWESLTTNLPDVAVTGLVIHEADVIIATAGRGAWVLEDFSPLRQLTPDVLKAGAFLFRPPLAWRNRAGGVGAAMERTARGVALTFLAPENDATVTLDIIETATGETVRRFAGSGADRRAGDEELPRGTGLRRVVWDLRYTRPEQDPAAPAGARVLPGTYQVRLTTATQSIRQSVAVRLDPRVRTAAADLAAQRTLARALDRRRAGVAEQLGRAPSPALTAILTELRNLTQAVNDVDARPSASLDAAATDALARAQSALDAPQ